MARGLSTKGRFAVAYLLLGAAIGAGIGTFIVLLQREGPQPAPPWSSWKPGSTTLSTRMLEIARHVGKAYKLPSGDPLVAVRLGGSQGGADFAGVAVVKKDNVRALEHQYGEDETAVFILCGQTKTCAIPEGEPSVARGAVLRREALELALYTLEYVHAIDNVLIFFPPGPGEKTLKSTLLFNRDDLSSSLSHPLRRTLPQKQPPLSGQIAQREKETVDELTVHTRYKYLGVAQNVIVIQPPA
ncbi:MAG TPA: hypothetical protein VKB10_11945 [Gaiellaceae bacterium]|nr:hypothetical protein [Gaiellaceae bacterium]